MLPELMRSLGEEHAVQVFADEAAHGALKDHYTAGLRPKQALFTFRVVALLRRIHAAPKGPHRIGNSRK